MSEGLIPGLTRDACALVLLQLRRRYGYQQVVRLRQLSHSWNNFILGGAVNSKRFLANSRDRCTWLAKQPGISTDPEARAVFAEHPEEFADLVHGLLPAVQLVRLYFASASAKLRDAAELWAHVRFLLQPALEGQHALCGEITARRHARLAKLEVRLPEARKLVASRQRAVKRARKSASDAEQSLVEARQAQDELWQEAIDLRKRMRAE
jgi:hypothetical protein